MVFYSESRNVQSFLHYRRWHKRVRADATGAIYISEKLQHPSIVRDISMKGASVVSNCPLNTNEKVTVVIQEPLFREPLKKQARVIWCKKLEENLWQTGLEFDLDHIIRFA